MVVFLEMIFCEFPLERFSVTYAKETMINEWDARGIEINEGVHSLGWEG
jgi:hypothetical protein